MSAIHATLHAARDAIDQLDRGELAAADTLGPIRSALRAAMLERLRPRDDKLLFAALSDLKTLVGARPGQEELAQIVRRARMNVDVVLGDQHRSEPCDRSEVAG